MAVGNDLARASARLAPYRLRGEDVRVAMQEHWAAHVEPSLTAGLTFILVVAINGLMPVELAFLSDTAWWLWFVLLVRALWELVDWQVSWFVVTSKRLLLLYGIVNRKVAMMPLSKVTDMSYKRSPMGMLLGYGTFHLESAGQDQALSKIRFVRDPDNAYRAICAEIFGSDDPDDQPRAAPAAPAPPEPLDAVPAGPTPEPLPAEPAPADPTDVPVMRMGSYLGAPAERPRRGRRLMSGLRRGRPKERWASEDVARAREEGLARRDAPPPAPAATSTAAVEHPTLQDPTPGEPDPQDDDGRRVVADPYAGRTAPPRGPYAGDSAPRQRRSADPGWEVSHEDSAYQPVSRATPAWWD